ncbi:MAG: MOSC domain-containing protein [Actinomycetota bacterium]|nr:MOSC domain-containing protein [Actinomycetota bacterium]
MSGAPVVGLRSVNVGMPRYLGEHRGHPVTSGIAKAPVGVSHLALDWVNLEGDAQAELSVHGGPDKAVYAYSSENQAVWSEELGDELGPASFGENLTTEGCTEDDVCIGDRWEWGDALLEVCQPRWPCYKLTMYRGRADIGRLMRANGRTGWYLRVLRTGRVPVAGPIIVVERQPVGCTVRLAHEAASPKGPPDEVRRAVLALDPLADEWKEMIAERLP